MTTHTTGTFVLRGGTVIDPDQAIAAPLDVLVERGVIGGLLPSGAPSEAPSVDVSGTIVTPGLIDLHGHWWEGSPWGIDPLIGLGHGVTTACDAGTSGFENFPAFRRMIIDRSPARVLAFLHISGVGLSSMTIGELEDMRHANVDEAVAMARLHPDVIVGIKVRLGTATCGPHIMDALEAALAAAERVGLPVMAHIAEGVDVPLILPRLRSGDIVTHAFRVVGERGLIDAEGEVVPEAIEARERGVLFDIGHGCGSFAWSVYHAAVSKGFGPDIISTDLHRLCVDGPVYDLPTTMSKFIHAGHSLTDVVAATTIRPARALRREMKSGSLRPGRRADIAVLRTERGRYDFTDAYAGVEIASERLVPVLTVNGGTIVRPEEISIEMRPLNRADERVACGVPPVIDGIPVP